MNTFFLQMPFARNQTQHILSAGVYKMIDVRLDEEHADNVSGVIVCYASGHAALQMKRLGLHMTE